MNAMEMTLFLPADMARNICIYGTQSLKDAGRLINTFTQTCKIFEASFNDSNHCLCLIKKLSERFGCSNEKVAETLSIQAARDRWYLQNSLQLFCRHPKKHKIFTSRVAKLKRNNVDFDFTYDDSCMTCLMFTLSPTTPTPEVAKYLILNGADLHLENKYGYTAYGDIFRDHPYLIPFLVEHKKLEPNKTDNDRTPLINLKLSFNQFGASEDYVQFIEDGVKILLEAGADPELADRDGSRPLDLVRRVIAPHIKFVTLLEDAITKKHAPQK